MGPNISPVAGTSNNLALRPIAFFAPGSNQKPFWIEPQFFSHTHVLCFTCSRTASCKLHFFCDTILNPSMWITVVYPSRHISEFNSPSSTFM